MQPAQRTGAAVEQEADAPVIGGADKVAVAEQRREPLVEGGGRHVVDGGGGHSRQPHPRRGGEQEPGPDRHGWPHGSWLPLSP